MSTATQVRPVNVGAQVFAGHGAIGSALDSRAIFGGHVLPALPVADGPLNDAGYSGQCAGATDYLLRLFERIHASSFKHNRDASSNTNVLQVSCLITNVKNEKPDLNTFGGRLRYARELRGLTQLQLGRKAGMKGQSGIGNYEAGTRAAPRWPIKLARALNVRVEWLSERDGPMETGQQEPKKTERAAPESMTPYEARSVNALRVMRTFPDTGSMEVWDAMLRSIEEKALALGPSERAQLKVIKLAEGEISVSSPLPTRTRPKKKKKPEERK